MLFQILAPHFCAGIEFRDGIAVLAAPILRWSTGKRQSELEQYCQRKGWSMEPVNMTTHIMVDIETLGTRPGAIILSAAFVRFSDEAAVSLNFSIPEQDALGMEK